MMQHSTVPRAFAASVARYSGRTAVIGEDGAAYSYTQLDALRIRAARALLAYGIAHGDRVAIWAQNSLEWIIAGLAIHSVGAVLVPINTRLRGTEAGYQLQKSGAKLLFCAGTFLGTHYPALLAPNRPSSLRQLVVLNDAGDSELGWGGFLTSGDGIDTRQVDQRSDAIAPEDRLDILFTSGTTGQPKGVVSGHLQNLRVIAAWSAQVGLVPEDRYLIVNPFFHAFGYKTGWLAGLMAGCTVLPHAVFDASAVMQRIAAERISVLPGPPTLFVSLLADAERSRYDLSSLRATITGAATIAPALIERIRTVLGFKIVLTGYGLTETCGVVSLCRPDDDAETVALTSGRAIAGIELRCADAGGHTVPPGEVGEILVRGYNLMQGYLNDDAATREAIDAEGWLHTGDIGVLDTQGYLRITDRLKDLYICGGFNCYPAEIERIIAAHPAIAQVAVIGVPDARLGEIGKACVVLRQQTQLRPEELIDWCRERMANYKVPRVVELLAALPANAAGKVLKFHLRENTSARVSA